MHGRGAALLVSAVLGVPGAARALEPAQLDLLRDSAREALKPSCGGCHDRAQKGARAKALRIFDLRDADWAAHLNEEQMQHMIGRFEGFKMPQPDRVTVQRYLDAERARRAALDASGAVH